jgi:membrane protein
MALAMMLLYILLVPLLFLASVAPAALVRLLDPNGRSGFMGFLVQVAGVVVAWLISLVLFAAIYLVVPNRRVRWQEAWHGTVLAASLLVLYEVLFPIYVSRFLHPSNYGSIVGFMLVVLLFFYYLAFILLLGAEVTSWALGQRRALGDLATIMHEVQAHNSTCDAAGPTAGLPSEDLKHHLGAAAKATRRAAIRHEEVDHRNDGRPPERFRTEHSSLLPESGCGDGE